MCGICGVWHFDVDRAVNDAVIQSMCEQLIHRGPDESGRYCKGNIALGAQRLKVLDLQGSQQPLQDAAQKLALVCNGEVYNYRQFRSRYRFKTDGDIESILHLYSDYGTECVNYLDGMFAFALWDSRQAQLTLAVDRFGKKPLYYAIDGHQIVFASELKAILQYPHIARDLDFEALDEYLACGYISAPKSIFTAIRKVPPGHTLTVYQNGKFQLTQ